jgi:Bax protein
MWGMDVDWTRLRASVATGSGLAFAGVVAALSYQQAAPARPALEVVIDLPGYPIPGYPVDDGSIVLVSGSDRALNQREILRERGSTASISGDFAARGYTLERVRAAEEVVPRIVLAQLPSDLHTIDSVDQRKEVFITTLLPILLAANERIERQRTTLEDLVRQVEGGAELGDSDRTWLAQLAQQYKVEPNDFDELLLRVDIIPPSLAIAQAAIESGWGTSRTARTMQSLFGHTTGVMREGADAPDLRRFATLSDAVGAYIENLNTNRAYARFRATRAGMRRNGGELDSNVLVGHLVRYSERGADYIRGVRTMIRANDLRTLDGARFAN